MNHLYFYVSSNVREKPKALEVDRSAFKDFSQAPGMAVAHVQRASDQIHIVFPRTLTRSAAMMTVATECYTSAKELINHG